MVSDKSHEHIKVMVTTLKSGAVYSPVLDSAKKMGRKAAEVVSDEVSKGTRNSCAASTAASTFFLPAAMPTMIDSDMTMG
jgi:hypothetical protein